MNINLSSWRLPLSLGGGRVCGVYTVIFVSNLITVLRLCCVVFGVVKKMILRFGPNLISPSGAVAICPQKIVHKFLPCLPIEKPMY